VGVAVAVGIAGAAALCNAVTTILQRHGVEGAPSSATVEVSLIGHILRSPIWLAGLATMIGAFVLQAIALDFGDLATVQPVVVTELLFVVLILGIFYGVPLGARELGGTGATVGGLAAFLVVSGQRDQRALPSVESWIAIVVACTLVVVVTLAVSRGGGRAWRAAWLGVGAAVTFALAAGLTEATMTELHHGVLATLEQPFPYGLAVSGIVGLFLLESAFHAGPLTASQAAIVVVDPLASIAIGIAAFGEHLDTSAVALGLEVAGLAVMLVGLVLLASSPLVEATADGERLSALRDKARLARASRAEDRPSS
jgi:drug/metabolite transporter (DMT)-like permease